jgi:rhodanese-related sulfurtransferase
MERFYTFIRIKGFYRLFYYIPFIINFGRPDVIPLQIMIKPCIIKMTFSILTILYLIIFSAMAQQKSDTVIHILDVEEFIIQTKLHEDYLLLDVRLWMEYKRGRIPGAILVDTDNKLKSITDTLDFDRPLFLYCATNTRSSADGKLLAERGFKNIYILEPGFYGWKAAGKEIDKRKTQRPKHDE